MRFRNAPPGLDVKLTGVGHDTMDEDGGWDKVVIIMRETVERSSLRRRLGRASGALL